MNLIANNFESIKSELKNFEGRIIAVSKYVTIKEIIGAYEAGLRDFGEAKALDSLEKMANLPQEVVTNSCWHFIGHLQSNKAKKVVGNFEYIHSVDSFKLAKKIDLLANERGVNQKILLQVNIANEETKFGFSEEELEEVFPEIIKLESISVEGLMMMAPHIEDKACLSKLFSDTKSLKEKLEGKFELTMPELSMGMSNDYKIAATEGSTMVRIGTKIFE